jgi:hypothetical protein
VWPVSEARGARPVKEREPAGGGKPAGGAHGGGQGGPADLGQAGQRAGQPERVDPAVAVLALVGMGVQFGLGGPQQTDLGVDLGVDLGGQVGHGDRRVVGIQLQRGVGGGQPVAGTLGALVAGGGPRDQPGKPGLAVSQQGVGVAAGAFQHC